MRTLLIIAPEVRHLEQAEQHKREAADESPRISLLEDSSLLKKPPGNHY